MPAGKRMALSGWSWGKRPTQLSEFFGRNTSLAQIVGSQRDDHIAGGPLGMLRAMARWNAGRLCISTRNLLTLGKWSRYGLSVRYILAIFTSDLVASAAPILSGKCIMMSAAVKFSPAK